MNKDKDKFMFEEIFIILAFVLVIIVWLAQLLTGFQIFYKEILICAAFLISFFVFLFLKNKKIQKTSKIDFIALLIILLFALFNTYYAHETFFGGRDDGLYANQAVYIAKHHTFYIENPVVSSFPGHIETDHGFHLPFYLGYSSWLALNIAFFGINAVRYSNFILIFIGLLSLYLIGERISGGKIGLISVVALATTYPMFWFTRKTFSENLAFVLIWFGTFCLLKAYEKKKSKYLIPTIFSFGLFLTVRVEALALMFMLILLMLFLYFIKKEKWSLSRQLIIILPVSLLPALWFYSSIDTSYINAFFLIAKSFFSNFLLKGVTSTTKPEWIEAAALNKNALEYNITNLSWQLLSLYNFLLFIFIPIALFKTIRFLREKQSYLVWIIFFLLLPQFFYLFNPSISLDQPWFLRRFLPVILPVTFLFLGYIVKDLSKKLISAIALLLVASNLALASPILTFREFDGALGQVKKIENTNIDKKNSLILVDYNNLGHYKIAEPLFYVFNYNSVAVVPSSIKSLLTGTNVTEPILYTEGSFKIPSICDYDSIYLLTNKDPKQSLKGEFNNRGLTHVWEGPVSYTELIKECELFRLTKDKTVPEMAHLNVDEAKEYCSILPKRFGETNITIELLKLDDELIKSLKIRDCENVK